MKDNCIFCRIIAGEIPSATIFEDQDFKAILDVGPAVKGHVLLLPKEHCADAFELPEDLAEKVLPTAQKIARHMKAQLNCQGLHMLQNNGVAAGQTVFHYHLHLIPRFEGEDGALLTWSTQTYEEGEMETMREKLAVTSL